MKQKRRGEGGVPGVPEKRRPVIVRRLMFSDLPRWKCWLCRMAVGVPLFLVLALAVLTQTVLLRRLVLPQLEAELGLQISADWVYVGRDGALVMHDVQVRTPGLDGPAGAIVQVGWLRADVDWWSVLSSRPRITEVRLLDPLVRLSQSVDDATLNFASVPAGAPGKGAGGGAPMELPRIIGTRIALELGEHQGRTYTILKRLNLDGSLVPGSGAGGRQYDIRLHETSPRKGRPGMMLSGTIDHANLGVELTGVTLGDWPPGSIPTPLREQFRALDLKGDVVSTKFLARDGRWASVSLELADVGMNLPLPEEKQEAARPKDLPPMRMSGVSGGIEFTPAGIDANLKGRIEDLPYTVQLDFDGLDLDAAFRMDIVSENFQIAKNPDLLPYANSLIRKRFRSFNNPTGEVDTHVTVRRGPPTAEGAAPIQISGLVNFRHMDAAYDRFPYRFPDLSGVVRFDDQGVDLVRISGTAPSGATIFATGRIAPLGSDAGVSLDIDVTDMPLDHRVEEALGPQRGELIPAVFNQERYKAMVDAGLILSPERAGELRKQLDRARGRDPERAAELEKQLRAPVFAVGGLGRIHVNLNRPRGEDSDWFTTIDVRVPEAGLLVQEFPLPIEARDVTLHIDDDRADLTTGTFRALGGGAAEISLAALLHDPATGEKDFRPDVHVTAHDVPVDALFFSALPRGADGPEGPGGRGLVRSILQGLGITGVVDATAHVANRAQGPLGFDVHVDLARTAMEPPPGGGGQPIRVSDLSGTADVSEERLDVGIEGSLRTAGAAESAAAGRMAVRAAVTYTGQGDARRWGYDATVTGTGLDASAPVEDLVRAFSESTGASMSARRAELRPAGTIDAVTHVTGSSEAPTEAETDVSRAQGLELDGFGGRAAFGDASGTALFRMGAQRGVTGEFRSVRSALSFGGEETGELSLDGVYDFGGGPETDLAASIDGARFESGLTAKIVREKLGAAAGEWWEAARPRGAYDQRFALRSNAAGAVDISGEVLPHSMAFTMPEPAAAPTLIGPPLEVSFPAVEGSIRFSPTGGEVVGLVASAPQWELSGDGEWTVFGQSEYSAHGMAGLRADWLGPDLRAILPVSLRDALVALTVRVDGPVELQNGRFSIARRGPPSEVPGGALEAGPEQTADYSGLVKFENASLDSGVKVSGMDGSLEFESTQLPGDAGESGLQYGLKLRADRLTAAGVRMTDGRARVVSGDQPGEVVVPLISARSHGGRVVAQGHAWPSDASPDANEEPAREFEASAQWSGLRFSPVMADLAAAMTPDNAKPPPPEDDVSRGVLEGELSIAGVVGDDSTRRGRGTMRVAGGRVVQFPLVMQLIEVSNLVLPVNSALDFARVSMIINGREIVLEDVSIFSSAVSILGYGTMSWPGTDLNLRFRSKAAKPIPILSRIIEGLRDELIGTVVRGTVAHPVVTLQQFPETRRLIDRAMGQAPSGQERQMDQIERRARAADTPPAPAKDQSVQPTEPDGPR